MSGKAVHLHLLEDPTFLIVYPARYAILLAQIDAETATDISRESFADIQHDGSWDSNALDD